MTEEPRDSRKTGSGRYKFVRFVLLVVCGGIIATGAIQVYLMIDAPRPFPPASAIDRIDADLDDPMLEKGHQFVVPQAYWKRIFDAMLPARRDDRPMKWIGAGNLKVTLKTGDSLNIWVFSSQEEIAAFAIGPTWEQRIYYRGGNSGDLEKALDQALKASRAQK
jgi:hypothetical protein